MRKKLILLVILLSSIQIKTFSKAPKLTVVFIIDQFAYHYIEKLKHNLIGGIKHLVSNGVFYKNAYMPNGAPSTSAGHAIISTGTYGKTSGIIGNGWLDKANEKTAYESLDIDKKYAVFSPYGLYKHAKAPSNILVDTLSDQFVLKSKPGQDYKSFAISLKSRAAIALAGKLGKAIWFDEDSCQFTSSRAYFEELPSWVKSFNKKHLDMEKIKELEWRRFHKDNIFAYNFKDIKNYDFARSNFNIIGEKISNCGEDYIGTYVKTPHANKHLLDLAKECLEKNIGRKKGDKFILWISLSSLDKLGHCYGPDSQEAIDMIYHLDWQIDQFMKYIEKKLNPQKILYTLTADHGIMPIVEILKGRGISGIRRINKNKLMNKINNQIEKKHKIKNVALRFVNPQIYLNKKPLKSLSKKRKDQIKKDIKKILINEPGILKAWTYKELSNEKTESGSIDSFFKNQLFKGRSGQIICKTAPYSVITNKMGSQHKTPYEFNTHIPLVIYRKNHIYGKHVKEKVLMTRLANTLAKILKVSKPAASTFEPLPL